MIGLVVTEGERPVAEEFFQLFKTPWEPFHRGRAYEAVITTDEIPRDFTGTLALIYSSARTRWDEKQRNAFARRFENRLISFDGEVLPIYGSIASEPSGASALAKLTDNEETVAVDIVENGTRVIRIGYNLFEEIAFLLSEGQPAQNALFPTLELHIAILRDLLTGAGLPLVEIPPAPPGTKFISCLTHDIDFVWIRQHGIDRAVLGFLYRASIGTALDFLRGRAHLRKLAKNALAILKFPLVHLGWCRDFWFPFDAYLAAEQGRPSTFFLIPFGGVRGTPPPGQNSDKRAVCYDVEELWGTLQQLPAHGCEVAVHGLDAWCDPEKGRAELGRIASLTGPVELGVRMHWLFFSAQSPSLLEQAGFTYDSTCGYNDAVGYRAGTTQVFKPLQVTKLLELPLHIQDTAMFYPGRMHLAQEQAWRLAERLLEHAREYGGALTLLWHDKSLAPERLWDDFYSALLKKLTDEPTWFATCRDTVNWFKKRRNVRFRRVERHDNSIDVLLENVSADGAPDLSITLTTQTTGSGKRVKTAVPLAGRSRISFPLPSESKAEFALSD